MGPAKDDAHPWFLDHFRDGVCFEERGGGTGETDRIRPSGDDKKSAPRAGQTLAGAP